MVKVTVEVDVPEGVYIKDKVYFSDNKGKTYADGVLTAITSDGRYVDESGNVWKYIYPVPKKKVKPLKELTQILLDEGYLPCKNGGWFNSRFDYFSGRRFKYCDSFITDVPDKYHWEDSWLTEE